MAELRKDPKVIASAQKRLVPGERVLWAARQPLLARPLLKNAARVITAALIGAAFMILVVTRDFSAYPHMVVFLLAVFSPHLVLSTLEMMSLQFIVTDRRVMFVSAFWPFRWSFWNHAELDADLVRLGRDRKVILLGPKPRGVPILTWNHAVYPHHIEGVPDIEVVRQAILAQIASRPAPVDRSSKGPLPPMPGTRTG